MSIAVAVEDLVAAVAEHDYAYVITVGPDATAHLVAATPSWSADGATIAVGRTTRRNVGERAAVTLCYPPREREGYTLIVDGTAEVAGEEIEFRPTGAILHRPAPGATPGPTGCVSDCVPVPPRASP